MEEAEGEDGYGEVEIGLRRHGLWGVGVWILVARFWQDKLAVLGAGGIPCYGLHMVFWDLY